MGAAAAGNNHFNAFFKNTLDWLPDSAITNLTTNGLCRLYPFDVPTRVSGRVYSLKIHKDYQRDYWAEFRQKFTGDPGLRNGLLLNWSAFDLSSGGSELLDATPSTPGDPVNRGEALVIGRTFTDPNAGVHITPVALGATGTNTWLDVRVNLGAFADNQPPDLQVEVAPPDPAPGSLVHLHATASDPDGDTLAYAWTFDDGSFSTNNLPWTFKTFAAGDHVVRCVVSDMKGGVASANALVTVGAPSGSRVTGQVLDGDGLPIEGVRIDNEGEPDNYLGGFTDSGGRYVITGASGDLNLFAFKYGYTFTNITWVNPLTADSNLVHIDFIALPLTNVVLAANTNQVPENSSTINYFLFTRSGDTTTNLTVNVTLSGSATVGRDFILDPPLTNGLNAVDIPPGTNALWIAFRTINDSLAEGPETATLTLADDPSYVLLAQAEATITILDDDLPSLPAVSVMATTPAIPENGADLGEFVFSRTGDRQKDLIVNYSASGTATPGDDYASLPGVVVIPAGQASASVRFQPVDDKDVEPDETVIVTAIAGAAYTVIGSSARVTILDDDVTTVTIFPKQNTAAEPSAPGRFSVKREGELSPDLVVYYTVAGTATSETDYVPLSGSVTIPAGLTSADIVLTPRDDNLIEGDESVILTLSASAAYSVGTPSSATLFIRDKARPYVTITATDDTASEPGDDFGAFTISRGDVVNGNLTIPLAISGTAMNGIDYVPIDDTVVIPDGAASVTINIIPFDDLLLEPTEDVILTLLPGTDYNLGSPLQARVQVLDDDPYSVPGVGFTFSSSSAPESQSPGISVSLSQTSAVPITVNYRVVGGTAAPGDYTLPPPPLTFEPGEWAKTLPLEINDNAQAEPNRTIRLVLYDPIYATLDGIKIHTYTILDDDASAVSVRATAPGASETGPVAGNFRISRAGNTNAPLVVNFQVTGTASAPADYAPLGTAAIIPAGASYVDLPVVPEDDHTVEHPETVVLTLISASASSIVSPNAATITITDNDPNALPVVAVTSTNHPAAVEGGVTGEFVLWRDDTHGPLTVYFSLAGTARSGTDYLPLTNAVTFLDGQPSVSLPVLAVDDALIEGERTLVLNLTQLVTYRAAYPASAIVTIQDNDQRVRIDASDFTAAEPGTDAGEFTFSRFGTTNTDLRVFFTISGSASNGLDYVALPDTIVIPAGSLSTTLPILPIDDTLVEGPETVTLTLLPNAAYALDFPTNATMTLNDDEPMLTILATVPETLEGGQQPGVFTLIRTGDPKYSFTARLALGGTATYGVDYPPVLTNLYFSCGVTAIDLSIWPINELAVEGPETVAALLLPDPAYTILYPSNALVTVQDAGTNEAAVVLITSPKSNPVYLLGSTANLIVEASIVSASTTVTTLWSQVAGPCPVIFGDTNSPNTTISFTNRGFYVLRLTAGDGMFQTSAELSVGLDGSELLSTNALHWAFDEAGGTNVLDWSGANHDGILVGHPVWVTNGALGGALSFAGSNDCAQATNRASFLDGLKAFTLSMFVKWDGTNADQGIFSAADSGTNGTLSISSRRYASCGTNTNVLEATIPTSRGFIRHVSYNNSLANVMTDGWQHLALVWSNGLAPVLYINGQPDHPSEYLVSVGGILTNCPAFRVGQGPPDWPLGWDGLIDEVRLYDRALSPLEVGTVGGCGGCANLGPLVDAGTNVTVQLITPVKIAGTVSDDGLPVPPGAVTTTWTNIGGPVAVVIPDVNGLTNTVSFTDPGEYVFRLIADDGDIKTYDDVTVKVIEPTRVDLYATDPEAAELGPDTGQFTFYRDGDTTFDLPVFVTIGGIASNVMDYVELTNLFTIPAGEYFLQVTVEPFLDHRTEGDETVTLTINTNLAYSIGNGEATVIIHDSPYGAWTVSHFTLEQLTNPTLSGEGADFDHDGLVNFAEYAANLDPTIANTNAPLAMSFEPYPDDNLQHLTLTYHRRFPPTDVAYAVYVSNDLLTWNTGTDYVEELQVTDDGNGLTQTVKARLVAPVSTASNQFATVRVWLLTTKP